VTHPQPAKKSYLLYTSFIDLYNVIIGAFANCGNSIVDSWRAIKRSWRLFRNAYGFWAKSFFFIICLFPFGLSFTRLIFTSIMTPLICLLITMVQISILLALFIIAYGYVAIIIVVDWLFCLINSINSHCPNCGEKFILPKYICDCGREHDRLTPGVYGIFKRQCNCGKMLSTSFITGRHKHDAYCPVCDYDIEDYLQASVCIPVVGGAHSGKTCYISMTMLSLEKNASKYGLTFHYEQNERDVYQDNVANLSRGRVPLKTQNLDYLTYYQFALSPRGAKIQQMISLCDVAGELYDVSQGKESIARQKGFRFANAFILIIDPLSIAEYRAEIAKTVNINNYKSSSQPIEEVVDTLINTMQNIFSLKAKDIINTNVAVVFTKIDIPGLADIIGNSAVAKQSPSSDQKTRYQVQNQLCEDFLRKYGEQNFLLHFKARFKSIQFFACSALGHLENGQPFIPINVEEPLFWLLKKKSNVLGKALK